MENNSQSFWQFSDQLRDQNNINSGLSTLSLNNDSIWGNSYVSKKPERRNFNTFQAKNERNFDSFDSTNAFRPKETDFNDGFRKFDKFDSNKAFNSNKSELNKGFRKFDIRVGGELNSVNSPNSLNNAKETNFNGFNHNWKIGGADINGFNLDWKSNLNTGFNNIGAYSKPSMDYKIDNNRNLNNLNNNFNVNTKGYFKKSEDDHHFNQHNNNNNNNNNHHGVNKFGKKNKNSNKDSNKDSEKDNNKNSVEKRFKTLPPSEALPRDETIGGYIFVCNNDTMEENLQRQLFGLPPRYRDSVRSITPGLPLFLYNYSTHQLHGIYEASSFGGTNIDASAWEDKKNHGESRFPAQVRVMTRKICEPLEEDSFRPILHHYDGPKFRLELNIPEVLSLLDIFSEH